MVTIFAVILVLPQYGELYRETLMRKPMSFFVSTLSLLLFLSLTFAACGRSTVDSSVATPPSLARDPVNQVYALAWSPNGTDLATGGKNGLIQVWNTKSKTRLVTVKQHFGEVHALAWSPAGTRLASGGQDFTVHLWNPTTGQQVAVYRSTFSTGEVLAVARWQISRLGQQRRHSAGLGDRDTNPGLGLQQFQR